MCYRGIVYGIIVCGVRSGTVCWGVVVVCGVGVYGAQGLGVVWRSGLRSRMALRGEESGVEVKKLKRQNRSGELVSKSSYGPMR